MLRIIVPAIMVLAAAGAALFNLYGKFLETALGSGLFIETYRFLLVVVVGGGVTLLYNHFKAVEDRRADARERERERERARKEELRRIWDELSALYSSTLRQVSELRAKLLHSPNETGDSAIPLSGYLSAVDEIREIQIRMSDLHQRMLSQNFVWDDLYNKTGVLPMADYLDSVVAEQEWAMTNIQSPQDGIKRDNVPNLMELLTEESSSSMKWEDFQHNYHAAIRRISQVVLGDDPT